MISKTGKYCAIATVLIACAAMPMMAAAQALSQEESDPRTLGWMEGFPPAPDKLIMQPDSNFFSFPKLRWTVCHFRELLPTEQVSRGIGAPEPLPYDLDETAIAAVTFRPMGSRETMTCSSTEKGARASTAAAIPANRPSRSVG